METFFGIILVVMVFVLMAFLFIVITNKLEEIRTYEMILFYVEAFRNIGVDMRYSFAKEVGFPPSELVFEVAYRKAKDFKKSDQHYGENIVVSGKQYHYQLDRDEFGKLHCYIKSGIRL
jgi:hypothetical protein